MTMNTRTHAHTHTHTYTHYMHTSLLSLAAGAEYSEEEAVVLTADVRAPPDPAAPTMGENNKLFEAK
jgi:hypothetical protein